MSPVVDLIARLIKSCALFASGSEHKFDCYLNMMLCRLRNIVAPGFNRIKNACRVAICNDRTAESVLTIDDITSIRLRLRNL